MCTHCLVIGGQDRADTVEAIEQVTIAKKLEAKELEGKKLAAREDRAKEDKGEVGTKPYRPLVLFGAPDLDYSKHCSSCYDEFGG